MSPLWSFYRAAVGMPWIAPVPDELGAVSPGPAAQLILSTIGLAVGVGSSEELIGADGVAVVSTMVIPIGLGFPCSRQILGWGTRWATAAPTFMMDELALLGASVFEISDGGRLSLTIADAALSLMGTRRGANQQFERRLVTRFPGLVVLLDRSSVSVLHRPLHNLKPSRVTHEQIVKLTTFTRETPWVAHDESPLVEILGSGLFRMPADYRFAQQPSMPSPREEAGAENVACEGTHRMSSFHVRETSIEDKRRTRAW